MDPAGDLTMVADKSVWSHGIFRIRWKRGKQQFTNFAECDGVVGLGDVVMVETILNTTVQKFGTILVVGTGIPLKLSVFRFDGSRPGILGTAVITGDNVPSSMSGEESCIFFFAILEWV